MKRCRHIFMMVMLLGLVNQACVSSFPDLNTAASIQEDIRTVILCKTGLESLMEFTRENSASWGLAVEGDKALGSKAKQDLINTWSSMLDYLAQLDHIQEKHARVFLLDDNQPDNRAIYCYYLAFLTQYRSALEFLSLVESNASIHIYLNEAYPQNGLKANLYKQFKYHFLNILLASKFVALDAIVAETKVPADFQHLDTMNEAEAYLYDMGMGSGTTMTLENGYKMMQDAAFEFWLPLQKGFSRFLSGKKVWRIDKSLMTQQDMQRIALELEPGDIIFTRKEWALTNLGLPGFWTHTAMYTATPEQRSSYFDDEETRQWVRGTGTPSGDFEELLSSTYESMYVESQSQDDDGNTYQIIEALKPGVIFNSLETTLTCDGVAVLRPKVSKREKARAISYAFASLGKPYDLNFDFHTDSALVCSELILKAYEPSQYGNGLDIRTLSIGQRFVTPCNTIIQQFSEEYGSSTQQLEFVLFYDGDEKHERVDVSTLDELLISWKRPDWHVFIPE